MEGKNPAHTICETKSWNEPPGDNGPDGARKGIYNGRNERIRDQASGHLLAGLGRVRGPGSVPRHHRRGGGHHLFAQKGGGAGSAPGEHRGPGAPAGEAASAGAGPAGGDQPARDPDPAHGLGGARPQPGGGGHGGSRQEYKRQGPGSRVREGDLGLRRR